MADYNMKEILYDENTKMINGYPEIKKLGICSPYGEETPFVKNGRLYCLELIDPSALSRLKPLTTATTRTLPQNTSTS